MKNINIKNTLIWIIVCLSFVILMVKFLPYSLTHKLTIPNYTKEDLIMSSVLENNICVTKFLIEHKKIDINKQYRYGHTLLHNAALYGDIRMVRLLVKNGTKLIKNDFGLTAISSARDNEHNDVMEYLIVYYGNLDTINEIKEG